MNNLATHPRTYNYYALTAAILNKKLSIDSAINKFSPSLGKNTVDSAVIAEMVELKKTMTYAQIGKIYGISDSQVYRRIKIEFGYRRKHG